MKRIVIWTLALLAVAGAGVLLAGCGLPNLFAYPFADRDAKESVKREHDLTANRLLILPYASNDVLFEYPTAPLDVSTFTVQEIRKHLRGKVDWVINPNQVALYQQSDLDWPNKPVAEIGRHMEADKVLYIELRRFTMMEERSANLYRGRVSAHVKVVDATAPTNTEAVLYSTDLSIEFPGDRPLGMSEISPARMEQLTLYTFAKELIWKFYDHEEPRMGG